MISEFLSNWDMTASIHRKLIPRLLSESKVNGKVSQFYYLCHEDKSPSRVIGLLKHSFGNKCGQLWNFTFLDMVVGCGREREEVEGGEEGGPPIDAFTFHS